MAEKVNTTKSIKAPKIAMADLDEQIKKSASILNEQKKVEVTIPAFLKKRLGPTVPVGINGAVIHVPVGVTVKIPESMAKVLNESIKDLKL